MNILQKLFSRKEPQESKTGGIEDYMSLIRVYFQASIAARLGITNINMVPDLRIFKTTFHVATANNKLGVAEKKACKKMMEEIYDTKDDFFQGIDDSIKKNCRKLQDVQTYLYQFQGFTQNIMMLIGNLMKFKLRMPSIFKKTIYSMTEQTVHDIFNKNTYTEPDVVKAVMTIRQLNHRLGFSEQWCTDFVYQMVMLAKKEPRPADDDVKKK